MKRSPASKPPTSAGAGALAAKLQAITEAATGLWRAGVTKVTLGGDSFDLQEPPLPPKQTDGEGPLDPYTVEGYAGRRPKAGGS